MIERIIDDIFYRYEKNRVSLGMGIDENGRNMVNDVRNKGLRRGLPIAIRRYNEHFLEPDSNKFDAIMILGLHAIYAGWVFLFGNQVDTVFPKKKRYKNTTH